MSSRFRLIRSNPTHKVHFIEAEIESGRKHQIRKQCGLVLKAPIIG